MGYPVSLRDDFDASALRLLSHRTRDADQSRRLSALAAIYDGGSRGDAARIGSVGLQTVRDWVLRFNALASTLIAHKLGLAVLMMSRVEFGWLVQKTSSKIKCLCPLEC